MPYRLSNGVGQTVSTDKMTDATIRAQKQRGDIALRAAQASMTPGMMTARQTKIMAQIERLCAKHMRDRETWREKSDAYRKKVNVLLGKLKAKAPVRMTARTVPTRRSRRTR